MLKSAADYLVFNLLGLVPGSRSGEALKKIELKGNPATVRGSYTSLAGAIKFVEQAKNLSTPLRHSVV